MFRETPYRPRRAQSTPHGRQWRRAQVQRVPNVIVHIHRGRGPLMCMAAHVPSSTERHPGGPVQRHSLASHAAVSALPPPLLPPSPSPPQRLPRSSSSLPVSAPASYAAGPTSPRAAASPAHAHALFATAAPPTRQTLPGSAGAPLGAFLPTAPPAPVFFPPSRQHHDPEEWEPRHPIAGRSTSVRGAPMGRPRRNHVAAKAPLVTGCGGGGLIAAMTRPPSIGGGGQPLSVPRRQATPAAGGSRRRPRSSAATACSRRRRRGHHRRRRHRGWRVWGLFLGANGLRPP